MIQLMDIRKYVVSLLKAANIPRIGNSVYPDRSLKFLPDELPAICVYTRQTSFDGKDRQPRWYQGETSLVVESVVRGEYLPSGETEVQTIADQLNILTQHVLDTVIYVWDAEIVPAGQGFNGPFGGLCDDVILSSIRSSTDQDGEYVIGGEAITFTLEWQTLQPPVEPPDSFDRMGFELKAPEESNAEDLDIDDIVVINPPE